MIEYGEEKDGFHSRNPLYSNEFEEAVAPDAYYNDPACEGADAKEYVFDEVFLVHVGLLSMEPNVL